jgi:hypothetical protein
MSALTTMVEAEQLSESLAGLARFGVVRVEVPVT